MTTDPALRVRIEQGNKHFTKVRDSHGNVLGRGQFSVHVKVTAVQEVLYIPLSVASGKKPTGFVYQIEGTGEGGLVSAEISLRDVKESGVRQVLLGTINYCEIPQGKTATFRIVIEIKGSLGKEYTVVINRIQYKFYPTDTRYQKYMEELRTDTLKFH